VRLPNRRLPYNAHDAEWLRGGRRTKPTWVREHSYWEVPKAWFNELVGDCLRRLHGVYVVQLYRETQKCAPACWNAQGFDCECSCLGVNHGSGSPGGHWHIVSEALAFQRGELKYACRLLTRKETA
jgi:hypothetical protein